MSLIRSKFMIYILSIPVMSVIAAIYGAIHNQITYTIAPEYFTSLKFPQFGLSWAFQSPRTGASVVGIAATWWAGAILAILLGAWGLKYRDGATYLRGLFRAYIVVIITVLMTFVISAIAISIVPDDLWNFIMDHYYHERLNDQSNFARVGALHNSSYFGGFLGLITGSISLFRNSDKFHLKE